MQSHRHIFFSILIFILITIVTLVSLEVVGQFYWRMQNGNWYFSLNQDVHFYRGLFEPHPYLVVAPRPRAKIRKEKGQDKYLTVSHNSLGFRGPEVTLKKPPNIYRIAVMGGSTTYCVSVSDNQTWPFFLQQQLGPGYEVINLGVPGYTTVEHIIQAALILPELAPDLVIFYTGWNDARNVHIDNLKSDYSDFHGKTQYSNLSLNLLKIGERSIIVYHLHNLLRQVFSYDNPIVIKPTKDAYTDSPDQRALGLYGRNLQTLITLCRKFNIAPVLVPQVLNYTKLMNDKQSDWAPYLRNKNLQRTVQLYNEKMAKIAVKESVSFVADVIKNNFSPDDFMDEGHFNVAGNQKFASMLASYIRKNESNFFHRSYSLRDSSFKIPQQ